MNEKFPMDLEKTTSDPNLTEHKDEPTAVQDASISVDASGVTDAFATSDAPTSAAAPATSQTPAESDNTAAPAAVPSSASVPENPVQTPQERKTEPERIQPQSMPGYFPYNQPYGQTYTPGTERSAYSAPVRSNPTKPKKAKKSRTALVAVCCALVGSILGGTIVGCISHNRSKEMERAIDDLQEAVSQKQSTSLQNGTPQIITSSVSERTGKSPAQVYAENVSAIVGISNEATTYNVFGQASATASSGSGFIISEDGEILTNYHVVEGAQTLTVTLYNGTEYPATVLGYEKESDVALLKIEGKELPTVTLGDSDALVVGAEVAAIGNPLGELTYTMTVGYVSAKDRDINTDGSPINMMQIDAAINSGNSGGPLFDMDGKVVGITTAKFSGNSGGGASIEGIGFAIPINDVLAILDDLRENGSVPNRAYIGLRGDSVTAEEADAYGLPLGVLISSVDEGSCGQKAGLRKSDIITAIDDTPIESIEDLQKALKARRAGDFAELTVYRSGRTIVLDIVFDAKPQTTEEPVAATEPTEDPYGGWNPFWPFYP